MKISFYTFIFEEEEYKELRKNKVKRKGNFRFIIFFGEIKLAALSM